jgi:hypothetical protein
MSFLTIIKINLFRLRVFLKSECKITAKVGNYQYLCAKSSIHYESDRSRNSSL